MLIRFLTILLICTLSISTFANNNYEDSILLIIDHESDHNIRIEHWLDLAKRSIKSNTNKHVKYSTLALIDSKKNNFSEGVISSDLSLGKHFKSKAKYDSALMYYNEALRWATEHHPKFSNLHYNIGNVHKATGNWVTAIDHYLTALKIAELVNSKKDVGIAQLGLGSVYLTQNNLTNSLEYFEQANNSFKEINDVRGIYISSNNMGTCHYKAKDYQKAKTSFLIAKKLAFEFRDIKGLGNIYGNLGSIYLQEDHLDSASFYANKSLIIRKKYDLRTEIVTSYHSLAEINIVLTNYPIAKAYIDSAFQICVEIESIEEYKYNWNYRAMLDSARGDYQSAFSALQKSYSYRSQLEAKEAMSNIEVLRSKYETQKKETEIVSLSQKSEIQLLEIQQKKQVLFLGTLLFLMLMAAAFFIYKHQLSQSQKSKIEIEQRFLRSQLNPHFIFNALSAIQNFVLKNEAKSAALYLSKFATLMREILENSRHEFISIDNEVKMLTNYLDIHQLRMDKTFEYDIELGENINPEIDTIPPMFVQPFVENAIEHGIIEIKENGKIEIKFTKKENYISIEVKDNGVGIVNTTANSKKHHSLASTIVQERMNLFNKSLKNKIKLIFEDASNAQTGMRGTIVKLSVPYK